MLRNTKNLIAGYDFKRVIADRSYDAEDFLLRIAELKVEAVISPRQNGKVSREYYKHLYKERHLVECFIGKIKHYRHIFSRFDKLDRRYLGFLSFTVTLIWLQ
jgi:transposase